MAQSAITEMPESDWRLFVMDEFKRRDAMHEDTLKLLHRIDTQTRLARNIQDISKATRLLYGVASCIARVLLRVAGVVIFAYIAIYLLTHNGHVPEMARELLTLIRKD